jgi:CheY-like chemotaxis protein
MILWIDDEPRSLDSFIKELEFSGYEVEFTKNVDDGLKFFHANSDMIELIISDMMMPGSQIKKYPDQDDTKTGQYFYEEIRRLDPNMPIILFTNFSIDEELEKITSDDSRAEILHKPDFLPYEFLEKIKDFLSRLPSNDS